MSSTGQIAGGVVGAIIGSFTPAGAWLGAQIGMTFGGLIDPPKGPTVEGPRLADLTVQTSTYGAFIGRVKGTVAVTGNVFWLENNAIKEVAKKTKKGGKGGGSKSTTRSYSYYATFAVGLADVRDGTPFAGIRRIWIGPDLYYDAGSSDPDTIAASNAAATTFHFYNGDENQGADPRIQAALGVANVPAWRGLAYIVLYDLPLANYQNSLPGAQVRVEVVQSGATGFTPTANVFTFPSSNAQSGPIWDGSKWLALAMFNTTQGKVVTSTDMVSWTQPTSMLATYKWSCLDRLGSLYVLSAPTLVSVSAAAVATSPDGINWTVSWWGSEWYWQWIVIGNGGILHIEGQQGTGTYSGNGVRSYFWNGITVDYVTNYGWLAANVNCINCQPAFNGAVFIVGGKVGATKVIYTSPTGIGAWTSQTVPTGITDIYGFCAFGASILMVGWDSGANIGKTAISIDNGVTWSSWVNLPTPLGSLGWAGPSWNGSTLIVFEKGVGSATYQWATSPDGVTWTAWSSAVGMPSNSPNASAKAWNGSAWGSLGRSMGNSFLITSQASGGIVSTDPTLAQIVSDECLQTGILTAGDLNVAALTQPVRGYRVGALGTIRSALEPLQASWPFDIVQAGYQIKFVPRGGSAVATISAGDLGARGSSEADAVQITMPRESDPVLPRRVTVRYLDYDREYESGEQYSERSNTTAVGHRVFEAPIVLTSDEGAGKAETLLYQAWLDRVAVAFSLPGSYGALEPSDVVNLPTPEGTISVRIEAIDYTSDGRLQCKARLSAPAIYTPVAIGAVPLVIPPATIVAVGGSVYQLLDIPYLSSQQAATGIVVAMGGAKSGWAGGSLIQTADGGATWANLADFSPPGATMGTTTNSIGVVESRLIDASSVLAVTLTSGALYSCNELAMLAGTNFFAYGADGRWEIIAARTCTLQTGTSYLLSDMLRGLFGTELAMGTHAVGDALVLLDSSDLLAIAFGTSTIGLSRDYRGITVNRDISTDSSRAFTYRAVNLKPLSPIALTGNRDPSSNDWTLTWVRRTRSGGEWRDLVDADLGEASEAYEADIFSDNTYTVVKRTIPSTTQQCAYSSANQVSDFGSNQATLYVKIYQMSATVGRGTPLTASITR
jgi:hypothetical protein